MTNLFHADRLRKAAEDPLPQQTHPPPPPEEIDGEPEYEIDQVLKSRLYGRNKTLQYQVSWRGYDPDDDWYNASNLKNAPIALERFHAIHPTAPGPPVRLQDWIRAAAEDEIAQDHEDDNKAEREGAKRVLRRH